MNTLPNDPVMLLSVVNTQLRDNFSTLEKLCRAYNTDAGSLRQKLGAINYAYDEEQNQFI